MGTCSLYPRQMGNANAPSVAQCTPRWQAHVAQVIGEARRLGAWVAELRCCDFYLPFIILSRVLHVCSVDKSRYDRYIKKTQVNVSSILSFLPHQCTFFPFESFLDNNGRYIFSKSCRDRLLCFDLAHLARNHLKEDFFWNMCASWASLKATVWCTESIVLKGYWGQPTISIRNYSLSNLSSNYSLLLIIKSTPSGTVIFFIHTFYFVI